MLTPYLSKLIKGEDLNADESEQAMKILLSDQNPEQIAAFLALMRCKGERVEEMVGFIRSLRENQLSIKLNFPVCDLVGTGGDGAKTANISTMASILVASCGVPVLKHGNRAVSSQSGSADVLEALGHNLGLSPELVAESVRKNNFGFCYAPLFHPALLALKPIRSRLRLPSFFNLLGPLLNPARAEYLILGVFDPKLMPMMADILIQLSVKAAMVVHGSGLDELNCLGPCQVIEIRGSDQKSYAIDPLSLGLPSCNLSDLVGGHALYNAELLKQVLTNQPSHLANTVILNAAAALYITHRVNTLSEGIEVARTHLKNGSAARTLTAFLEFSEGVRHVSST